MRIHEDVITPSSTVLRTELSIFSCSLRLAGQIDCICRDRNGKLVIWDWKRSKKIQMDSQQQMKAPLSHLPDCNFFAYALQDCVFRKYSAGGCARMCSVPGRHKKNAGELNVYRFILEPGWGQLAVLYGGG